MLCEIQRSGRTYIILVDDGRWRLQNVEGVQSQWALTAKVVELGRALRQASGDGILVAISIY